MWAPKTLWNGRVSYLRAGVPEPQPLGREYNLEHQISHSKHAAFVYPIGAPRDAVCQFLRPQGFGNGIKAGPQHRGAAINRRSRA